MSDTDRIFFDMAFVSILSFQFHPGNAHNRATPAETDLEIAKAANVAMLALRERNRIFGN